MEDLAFLAILVIILFFAAKLLKASCVPSGTLTGKPACPAHDWVYRESLSGEKRMICEKCNNYPGYE